MNEPEWIEVPNKIGFDGCADCDFYFECFSECDAKPGHHWELNPDYITDAELQEYAYGASLRLFDINEST